MPREARSLARTWQMKQVSVFGGSSLALVVTVLAVAWLVMSPQAWTWLAAAGGIALVSQLATHALLFGWRQDPKKFMRAVLVGAAARLMIVAVGLAWVAVSAPTHPVVFMLGLVGFLFGILLIESGLENAKRFRPGFAAGDPAVRG